MMLKPYPTPDVRGYQLQNQRKSLVLLCLESAGC